MKIPTHIWQMQGTEPGPITVILGGTHGDELTGIELVRNVLHGTDLLRLPSGKAYPVPGIKGTIFVGFGNPEAILRRSRGVTTRDLNRCFIDSELERPANDDDSLDLVRARELKPLLASADYLFDIHATSTESEPFVCFGRDSPAHRTLYRLIPVQRILTDPEKVLPKDMGQSDLGTTDSCVNNARGVGLCYETGLETDISRTMVAMEVVSRLLLHVGNVTEEFISQRLHVTLSKTRILPQNVYALSDCIVAQAGAFRYEHGMEQNWQEVRAGTKLGSYDTGQEVIVEKDGVLVFPKAAHKVAKGKSLYYLATLIEPTE